MAGSLIQIQGATQILKHPFTEDRGAGIGSEGGHQACKVIPCRSAVLAPVLGFRITWGEAGRLVDDQFNTTRAHDNTHTRWLFHSSSSAPTSTSIPAPLARKHVFFLVAHVAATVHPGPYRCVP